MPRSRDQWERNRRISRAARERAKSRTCPACGRGNALRHHPDSTGCLGSVTTCRWCPYEMVHPPVLDVNQPHAKAQGVEKQRRKALWKATS